MRVELKHYTQDRELSWLAFNVRVLEEALDEQVPLLERLRFAAIFSRNLDEFFMVRMARLAQLAAADHGKSAARRQMLALCAAVGTLCPGRDWTWNTLMEALQSQGIQDLDPGTLDPGQRAALDRQFRQSIFPFLSPQIVDAFHPLPLLAGGQLAVAARLERGKHTVLGLLPIPAALPRLIPLPGAGFPFVRLERLLLDRLPDLFPGCQISGGSCIRITRSVRLPLDNGPLDPQDSDLRRYVGRLLQRRQSLAAVRLESDSPLDPFLARALARLLDLDRRQFFLSAMPMNPDQIIARLESAVRAPALYYPPFRPKSPLPPPGGMLALVRRQDVLLSFPYQSMAPFLALLQEAAVSPRARSIQITVYRLARQARLMEILCTAARRGKEVLVFLELRARFDEANNIAWSRRLEEAGCRVFYGGPAYKVHAKLCLITFAGLGGPRYLTQIGTGNYNESTVRQYADLSLITSDPQIGAESAAFFRSLAAGKLPGQGRVLLTAPLSLKDRLLALIQAETAKGPRGRIVFKCNAITDRDIIRALSLASRAGVRVDLIVRGICCLRPGVPGYTDHIQVTSLVGRFLEHARLYSFGQGPSHPLYLGSADLMRRNTERRVELLVPLRDPAVRRQAERLLALQLRDTAKARILQPDGVYCRPNAALPFHAQGYLMEQGGPGICARRTGRLRSGRQGPFPKGPWTQRAQGGSPPLENPP
ncbi:polyphosphate kinase 1 [Pseudoflavonifractor sp. 524-17]|uniref:polyphosphate kinase 1 n=1 Tax=Pseudoflavonifractor sp. 524-17 TaxID=2304577 RepID=UPI0013796B3E|nr:polyphosphate kinase 1 [Pseudoflavonifractor sp. 524-17]NCE64996.1 polyphosphate kinase 1 [Pseudoflavonifractor sp. 524-17]